MFTPASRLPRGDDRLRENELGGSITRCAFFVPERLSNNKSLLARFSISVQSLGFEYKQAGRPHRPKTCCVRHCVPYILYRCFVTELWSINVSIACLAMKLSRSATIGKSIRKYDITELNRRRDDSPSYPARGSAGASVPCNVEIMIATLGQRLIDLVPLQRCREQGFRDSRVMHGDRYGSKLWDHTAPSFPKSPRRVHSLAVGVPFLQFSAAQVFCQVAAKVPKSILSGRNEQIHARIPVNEPHGQSSSHTRFDRGQNFGLDVNERPVRNPRRGRRRLPYGVNEDDLRVELDHLQKLMAKPPLGREHRRTKIRHHWRSVRAFILKSVRRKFIQRLRLQAIGTPSVFPLPRKNFTGETYTTEFPVSYGQYSYERNAALSLDGQFTRPGFFFNNLKPVYTYLYHRVLLGFHDREALMSLSWK
ncbi:hypothetical protein SCHPADRAFT_986256 [Schizopora paradoxa]|uniref:Uncharacterized protein n=1 Tax=Schizopora paradoxa TaxID=27342 RepID=A0A0H2RAN7_9AGAM|nr:hypothetical protein SCHPADRAFT_986256 [Schizopora paradoxa]